MSDVKNLYILKPDVIIDEYKDIRIVRPSHGSSFIQEIPNAVFDKLFELLDVESLTTQLEKLSIRIAHDLQIEDISWDETRAIIEEHLLAEVLELIGVKQ